MSASRGTVSAAYVQAACTCRPRFLCPFCRRSSSGTHTLARKPAKTRQRAAQPRKRLPQSGSGVTYRQAHRRVEAARGHATSYRCEDCGQSAAEWSYDCADPDELVALVNGKPRRYSACSDHYRHLCVRCHRRFDGEQRALRIFSSW
jgi:hypothetical protein